LDLASVGKQFSGNRLPLLPQNIPFTIQIVFGKAVPACDRNKWFEVADLEELISGTTGNAFANGTDLFEGAIEGTIDVAI
jgi:hypothetical protein